MLCKICNTEHHSLGTHLRYTHKIVTSEEQKKYYDDYIRTGQEGLCPVCGKETTFRGLTKGYLKFCSSVCSNSSNDTINKKKESTKLKHGAENYRNTEKAKNTRLERYGQYTSQECIKKISDTKQKKTSVELKKATEKSYATRCERYGQWRAEDTTQKIADTKLQRYGTSTFNNREKASLTCVEKYGTTHHNKRFLLEFISENGTAELLADSGESVTIRCKNCDAIRTISRRNLLKRPNGLLCDVCSPYPEKSDGRSEEEAEFSTWLGSIYDGEIRLNDRVVLDGQELDVYLPEKQLAFEFDGLYWHSEEFRPRKAHLEKTELCEAKGIQLIHIFEDEWVQKNDIVKSRICGMLGNNERVFARLCECRNISSKDAKNFLLLNHVQGACKSKYCYGLFHNEELISVMTFGASRFKNNEFELLRFCSKKFMNVIGGASKLFKHFLIEHPEVTEVISYADRRWSRGKVYEKLGMHLSKKTPPSYFYFKQMTRENRMKFQKHKLVSLGHSPNETEKQIMSELGYLRIFDCGCLKYSYSCELPTN